MPLSGNALGDAIKAAVDAYVSGADPAGVNYRRDLFRTMGNAIVTYLVANASVVVASVSGVTTGGGTSGPGTGTIV